MLIKGLLLLSSCIVVGLVLLRIHHGGQNQPALSSWPTCSTFLSVSRMATIRVRWVRREAGISRTDLSKFTLYPATLRILS
jgi:hypothetical protein